MHRSPLSLRMLLPITAILVANPVPARAHQRFVVFCDPTGDHTGAIDATKARLAFDDATGAYTLALKATPAAPFVGHFRIAINFYNPDAGNVFSDVRDFDLGTATTNLDLVGTNLVLLSWQSGHRVATNTLAGLGNPPGVSFFRSTVWNFPLGFLTNEDAIAYGAPGVTTVRPPEPVLACPAGVTLECEGRVMADDPRLAAFFAGVRPLDPCNVIVTHDAPAWFAVGSTVVTFTATDELGNTASCEATVTVVDTEPPVLSLGLAPTLLWPPNHKLATVHASAQAEDACDESPRVILASITSDEPDGGVDAEDLPGDIEAELGAADFDFALRSERAEEGDGRTYTVCYEARDASGNVARECAVVEVPHDRRGRASLLAASATWVLTIHGGPVMAARSVTPGSVIVGTGSFERVAASHEAPEYGDADGDGREDVTFGLTEGLSAAAVVGGGPLYARWEADGYGYMAEIAPGSVTAVGPAVPGALEASVWPNPGREPSRLVYTLPRGGHVRLGIYDIVGREVARLAEGWRPAGRHEVTWASGDRPGAQLYLFRLEALGRTVTGRFVVLD